MTTIERVRRNDTFSSRAMNSCCCVAFVSKGATFSCIQVHGERVRRKQDYRNNELGKNVFFLHDPEN